MRIFRLLAVCGILFGLALLNTGRAAAQAAQPIRTIDVQIGAYQVVVGYYSEAEGGRPLIFSIAPREALAGDLRYQVSAVPGTLVNAVPVKATLASDPERAGGVRGSVSLPVSGQWMLSINIDGPLGSGFEDVPVLAAAPPALPEWLGWAIGLLPIWAIVGFVLAQALRGRRQAATGQASHESIAHT
jgi:hypothetical protein